MDILETIKSRRSIKSYLDKDVPTELIEKVLTAGISAPSGMNRQSATVLAITNKDIIAQLGDEINKVRGVKIGNPLYGAPVALVVLSNKNVFTHVYDGSVVMENMLLEAHSLGLGGCWIHHAKEVFEGMWGRALLSKLGLNDSYEGVGTCIVGYPKTTPVADIKRKENAVIYIK